MQYRNTENNFVQNEWFDSQCRESKTEFKTARNTFLRHKTDTNRLHFVKMRTKYNRVKRRAKFKYKQKEGQNISNMAKTAPKRFWKEIKKKYKRKAKSSETLTLDDFYNHFKTVYGDTNEPSMQQDQDHNLGNNENAELDSEISESEVRDAVFSQKNNKSCGIDFLNAELFKRSYDIISRFLVNLFNRLTTFSQWKLKFSKVNILKYS